MTSSPAPLETVSDDLATALGTERTAVWRLERGNQKPAIRVELADGRPVAAILTSHRPATGATKIAHVWRDEAVPGSEAALERLVEAVIVAATENGHIAVKWQSPDDLALPETLGFSRLRTPYRSAAGTEGVFGYVRWLREIPHDEPPYYSQTSTFTCGAVTALLASEIRGSVGFRADDHDRDHELDFWRKASNYPAVEPIGLAVALRESLDDAVGSTPVEVFLDTEEPVLLESFSSPYDRAFREELQANSRAKALESDISVRHERIEIAEIARRLEGGELALMLVNIEPMYGSAAPHWVLAHAAADGFVLIDDPWISATWGETWVDSHELPIAIADLDRMSGWGESNYRGVVFLRRRQVAA